MPSPKVFTRAAVLRLGLAMALGLFLYGVALFILFVQVDPFPLSTATVIFVGLATMFAPALMVVFAEAIFRRRVRPRD